MFCLKLPKVEDHACLSVISPGPVLNLLPLLSGENPTDEQKNCGFYLVLFTPQLERASLNPIRKGSLSRHLIVLLWSRPDPLYLQ